MSLMIDTPIFREVVNSVSDSDAHTSVFRVSVQCLLWSVTHSKGVYESKLRRLLQTGL